MNRPTSNEPTVATEQDEIILESSVPGWYQKEAASRQIIIDLFMAQEEAHRVMNQDKREHGFYSPTANLSTRKFVVAIEALRRHLQSESLTSPSASSSVEDDQEDFGMHHSDTETVLSSKEQSNNIVVDNDDSSSVLSPPPSVSSDDGTPGLQPIVVGDDENQEEDWTVRSTPADKVSKRTWTPKSKPHLVPTKLDRFKYTIDRIPDRNSSAKAAEEEPDFIITGHSSINSESDITGQPKGKKKSGP